MFELGERRRLSDVIANRIREFIIANQLQPGDRLPTELEMAEQFGVSRVSLREATKALGFLGILEASPRRGTTVGEVDLGRVMQFLEMHPALRDATPQQLIDSRHLVELGILPNLMERMRQDPEIYQKLTESLKAFDSADDLSAWVELDRDFHWQMLDASGLSPLCLFHEILTVSFRRIQDGIRNPDNHAGLFAEIPPKAANHQRILDLLRDGQLEQAQLELKTQNSTYEPRLIANGCSPPS